LSRFFAGWSAAVGVVALNVPAGAAQLVSMTCVPAVEAERFSHGVWGWGGALGQFGGAFARVLGMATC